MDPVSDPKRNLSRSQLKLIAIFFMFLNHFSEIFLPKGTLAADLLTGIGYFTMPVMCYLLAEGFHLTSSLRNYLMRLFVFALLSQFPYDLAFTKDAFLTFTNLNMIYTLWISLLLLTVHTRPFSEPLKWGLSLLLVLATIPADWGIFAPVFTLMFYYAGNTVKARKEVWALVVLTIGVNYAKWTAFTGPVLAAICVICFYQSPAGNTGLMGETSPAGNTGTAAESGTSGGTKKERASALSRWFFYLFYPLHLLLFGIIRVMMMR